MRASIKFPRQTCPPGESVLLLRLLLRILLGCFTVSLAILVLSLVRAGRESGRLSIAGYSLYVVQSGSMRPAFETGSLIFVRPADAGAVKQSDIITYVDPRDGVTLVTHRVAAVSRDGLGFTTKGDANAAADAAFVPAENLMGIVRAYLPYAGYAVNFAGSPPGLFLFFILPGFFVLVLETRRLMLCVLALLSEIKNIKVKKV